MKKQALYKLTSPTGTTYNDYRYAAVGKVHSKPTVLNPSLCSTDVFHAYTDPNLAFLLNPIHANYSKPRLYEIRGDIVASDGLKVGSFEQVVVRRLRRPSWVGSKRDTKIRVLFALYCCLGCFESSGYKKHIKGAIKKAKENDYQAAADAADAADAAAYAAADAARAAARATRAAYATRAAADAAARAARAAYATRAAYTTADAAHYNKKLISYAKKAINNAR